MIHLAVVQSQSVSLARAPSLCLAPSFLPPLLLLFLILFSHFLSCVIALSHAPPSAFVREELAEASERARAEGAEGAEGAGRESLSLSHLPQPHLILSVISHHATASQRAQRGDTRAGLKLSIE